MVAAGIGEVAVVGRRDHGQPHGRRCRPPVARRAWSGRPVCGRVCSARPVSCWAIRPLLSEVGRIHVVPLPPPETPDEGKPVRGDCSASDRIERLDRPTAFARRPLSRICRPAVLPTLRDFPEAARARCAASMPRPCAASSGDGRLILSAAVPVQRYKQVLGVHTADTRQPGHCRLVARSSLRHADHRSSCTRHYGPAVALSRRHHHPADRATGACGRRSATGAREAGRRFPTSASAATRSATLNDALALDDRSAVAAHQYHRKLRRRRGARTQESPDLAAVGHRDGGATRHSRPTSAAPS